MSKHAPGVIRHTLWRLRIDIHVLQETASAFLWSIINTVLTLISACIRETQLSLQSFSILWADSRIYGEGFPTASYSRAPECICLHTTGELRSQGTQEMRRGQQINGDDWQPCGSQGPSSSLGLLLLSELSFKSIPPASPQRNCLQAINYNNRPGCPQK